LLVAHHLAVDIGSWDILLDDLIGAYRQLQAGAVVQPAREGTSFAAWAARLVVQAGSPEVQGELDRWLALADAPVTCLPLDYPDGRARNTFATAQTIEVALAIDETRALLREAPKAYRTLVGELLLTALAQALAPWAGSPLLLVDLEGNGRQAALDGLHLDRTVGWFTTVYPARLDLSTATGPGEAICAVKETLRAIPNEGLGYGLLRYLAADPQVSARMQGLPRADVTFLYLGQSDKRAGAEELLRPAPRQTGPQHSPQSQRPYLLEVQAGVRADQLVVVWRYSSQAHRYETIAALAQRFIAALTGLIHHCLAPDAGGYTPSDFALAQLSQDELDEMLAQLAGSQLR